MKYVLTDNTKRINGHKLYQICAIENKGAVKAGELGGFIEYPENLDQDGLCWITREANVFGCSHISDNARIVNSTIVDTDISGGSYITGSTIENSIVHDSHIADTKIVESHLMHVRCFGENPAILYDCQLQNTEFAGSFTFEDVEIEAPCSFTGPIHMSNRRIRIPIILHTNEPLHIEGEWDIVVQYENDECITQIINKDATRTIYRTTKIDYQTWS